MMEVVGWIMFGAGVALLALVWFARWSHKNELEKRWKDDMIGMLEAMKLDEDRTTYELNLLDEVVLKVKTFF